MNELEAQLYGAMDRMEKKSVGGKRKGAGRKPFHGVAKKTTSMRLTVDVLRYLSEHEETTGELVDAQIRRTADFKRWARENAADAFS